MSVDAAGNVLVSRCFVQNMDFDPSAAEDLRTSAGLEDIFVTQINSDGGYGWTYTMGGASSDCANAVVSSPSGDVAVTGNFTGTADFNPTGGGDTATALGGMDIFVSTFKVATQEATPVPAMPVWGDILFAIILLFSVGYLYRRRYQQA